MNEKDSGPSFCFHWCHLALSVLRSKNLDMTLHTWNSVGKWQGGKIRWSPLGQQAGSSPCFMHSHQGGICGFLQDAWMLNV